MSLSTNGKFAGLILTGLLVLAAFAGSIMFGVVPVSFQSVLKAFYVFEESREYLIIRDVRLPRAVIAAAVGSSLAVAGCLMQALSRNALAGPELFGINYGAALTAVVASYWFGTASLPLYAWSSLVGAAAAGVFVFLLSSRGGGPLSSVKFVLAGSTLNLLFASMTQGILIVNEQSLDTMRFWLAGSLTGRDLNLFFQVLPYLVIGWTGSLALSSHLNIFGLGDELAQGLGQRIRMIKILCVVFTVLLAGSAVALAGPIGFLGMAVPHIARLVTGSNYRWIVPYSALLGALLLLAADIGARFILIRQEMPVGVVTAFFGAPFLIYLAQRKER
ncbi:iron complex transport system permease protein [Paenibacillus sp. UNCCL117]|uniref:FecCD family ABC transporter permease n=1 Tax=unclassified Paenibacillus TaxID=185978 RepID=UPI0008810FA2|nr:MULTISPECIES: iron ABC transporter permease [unclassified Paenibacillus]SDC16934.1 iron complex transport system permease protein [Paenibacillus sp. cl123]SFW17907.1 iron complex transport system permease protein [Paenibacillus sp. UNCCL117]